MSNPTLPAAGAQLFDTAVFNAQVPREGPKALPLTAPFSTGTVFDVNLLLTQSQQFMSLVQSCFVDNTGNSAPTRITVNTLNRTVSVPPNSCAYLPLLVAKNDKITLSSEGGVDVPMCFMNVPVPAIVWNVTDDGGNEYVTVAASQAAQVLGAEGGAKGDFLEGLLIIPASVNPGVVDILDGATSITVFAGGAASVATLIPFFVPINSNSVNGSWSITTGAGVSVIALGLFT